VGILWVVELSNWCNVVDVRFSPDLGFVFTTVLAGVVVPRKRGSFHWPPPAIVDRFTVAPLFRHPLVLTFVATEATLPLPEKAGQYFERVLTVFTRPRDRFDIVDISVVSSQKLVCLLDTRGAVHTVLIRWIVLELIAAPFTLGRFLRALPVPVVFTSVRIAVLAVRLPRFGIVELGSTALALSIRKRITVDFGVMLTHPPLRREGLLTGRTLHANCSNRMGINPTQPE